MILEDFPVLMCVKCGREQYDLDGLGFCYCGHCGYCTHPAFSGAAGAPAVCHLCGTEQSHACEGSHANAG